MRIKEFIVEGYKEAEQKFVSQGVSAEEVKKVLDTFRDLVNRNQIQGNERNIDWWAKNKSFQELAEEVKLKLADSSTTQIKRSKKVGRSVNLLDNDNWLVVVPLDKDASCFHGKNSDWCTAKASQQYFEQYFYDNSIILIYCLNKKTGGMWAIANYRHIEIPDPDDEDAEESPYDLTELEQSGWAEIFDQQDNSIDFAKFKQQTGLDAVQLMDLSDQKIKPGEPIHQRITTIKTSIDALKRKIQYLGNARNLEIEHGLLDVENSELSYQYIRNLGKNNVEIDKIPIKILILATRHRGDTIITWLRNPNSKIVKQSIESNQTNAFKVAIERDFIRSEDLLKISSYKFDATIIKMLDNKGLLNKEVIKYLSSEAVTMFALNEAGFEVNPAYAEQAILKNRNTANLPSVVIKAMLKINLPLTPAIVAHVSDVLKIKNTDVKRLLRIEISDIVASLSDSIVRFDKRIQKAKDDIEIFKSRAEKTAAKIKELEGRKSPNQQYELLMLKTELSMSTSRITQLQETIDRVTKQIEENQKEIEEYNSLISKLEKH